MQPIANVPEDTGIISKLMSPPDEIVLWEKAHHGRKAISRVVISLANRVVDGLRMFILFVNFH